MDARKVKSIVQAILYTADEPVNVQLLNALFEPDIEDEGDRSSTIQHALAEIDRDLEGSSLELRRVASGYRIQARLEYAEWINRAWQRKPPRYSRALLETLALIAYRQPVTRGDIEQVRGVSVRPATIHTLLERGWIREVGKRQTPGFPTLFGTTKHFLDDFNLKSIDELPAVKSLEHVFDDSASVDDDELNSPAPGPMKSAEEN